MSLPLCGSQRCMLTNRRAAALYEPIGLLRSVLWCDIASLCAFFWLSRIIVAVSALSRGVASVATGEIGYMMSLGRLRQNWRFLGRFELCR